MPIFVLALAMPIVRTNGPNPTFCSAKTCSTRDRILDFALLALRVASGIGRPLGFLQWIRLTKPCLSRKISLAVKR